MTGKETNKVATNVFGIDLGTSNIKIYNYHNNDILDEKNTIAIEGRKKIAAMGDLAYDMYEKAPSNIDIRYPIANGVIADIESMQMLFKGMIERSGGKTLKNSKYIVAVPTDITEVEKRAFYDLVRMSNVREKKIMYVEKPIADAVGLGLDVNSAKGIMVVDVGADTTEISVISLGGIVLSKLLQVGGNHFDEAIQLAIKKQENFLIGRKTAEFIKKELTSNDDGYEKTINVFGRDIVTGLPMEHEISSKLVLESIIELLYTIVDATKMILERTPPELSSDIIENGIYMTGGSSNIMELAKIMAKETELDANICDAPQECVVRGIARIIDDKALAGLTGEINDKIYR